MSECEPTRTNDEDLKYHFYNQLNFYSKDKTQAFLAVNITARLNGVLYLE